MSTQCASAHPSKNNIKDNKKRRRKTTPFKVNGKWRHSSRHRCRLLCFWVASIFPFSALQLAYIIYIYFFRSLQMCVQFHRFNFVDKEFCVDFFSEDDFKISRFAFHIILVWFFFVFLRLWFHSELRSCNHTCIANWISLSFTHRAFVFFFFFQTFYFSCIPFCNMFVSGLARILHCTSHWPWTP